MMPAIVGALTSKAGLGVMGLLGGLLLSGGEGGQAPAPGAEAYTGQKDIAKVLAPYLWENLDVGLTEEEKGLYRGAGKTSILQSAKAAQGQVSKTAASQGLRGGRVQDILSGVMEQTIPQFAQLEQGIMGKDIEMKQKRVQDILNFMNLKAGVGPVSPELHGMFDEPEADQPGTIGGPGLQPGVNQPPMSIEEVLKRVMTPQGPGGSIQGLQI